MKGGVGATERKDEEEEESEDGKRGRETVGRVRGGGGWDGGE